MNNLGWKLIVLVLTGCYLVPGLVLGGFLTAIKGSLSPDALKLTDAAIGMLGFLVPPVTAGYLIHRHAPALPWKHVLVVGVLGALISLFAYRTTPRAMLFYAVASVLLAFFGGYVRQSGRKTD